MTRTSGLDIPVADFGPQAVGNECIGVDRAVGENLTKVVDMGEVHEEPLLRRSALLQHSHPGPVEAPHVRVWIMPEGEVLGMSAR